MQGEGRRVASLRATGARAEPLSRSPAYASPPCGLWMPASLTSLHPSTRWTERNTHAHTHTPPIASVSPTNTGAPYLVGLELGVGHGPRPLWAPPLQGEWQHQTFKGTRLHRAVRPRLTAV